MTSGTLFLFVHVEEPSMAEALEILLPKLLRNPSIEQRIIDHGSKQALLKNLPARLRGYTNWPEPGLRIVVLVDRDRDDCVELKKKLEAMAADAGLATKTAPDSQGVFRVVNRIVVEELEAWFLGDVEALVEAFPGVPPTLAQQAGFRDPDGVSGGTWEALMRVLTKAGHFSGSTRLPKIEVARRVAHAMIVASNRSPSFRIFVSGLDALLAM